MGEAKRRANVAAREAVEALSVDTVGGRVQVRWNTHRAATPVWSVGPLRRVFESHRVIPALGGRLSVAIRRAAWLAH